MSLGSIKFFPVFALAALILSSGGCVLADKNENAQGRAIWVARWSLTTPEAVKQSVKYAKDNNFNVLVVQVRGRGDAFYKSDFEPRSEYLEGQPEDFDPLALYVEEGRKAGVEIHAWLNTHLVWSGAELPKSPDHLVNKRPDWLMRTVENETITTTSIPGGQLEGAFTCPSNPEVKEYTRNLYLEVLEKYDVDGIHFDYVRYPNAQYCYCDVCLSQFKDWVKKELTAERIAVLSAMPERLAFVQAYPKQWDEFRRNQITDIVGQVYRRAKQIKPNAVVSSAVFANSEDAYDNRLQDWKLWMKMGILDVLYPMAYTRDTDVFVDQIRDAVENAHGRHVYAGIGQWLIPPEQCIEKTEKAFELGAEGICLFAYGAATDDGKNDEYLRVMKEKIFQEPVPTPKMEWMEK